MSWKSVSNWQLRRKMRLSEFRWHWPVFSKQGNYPDEEVTETSSTETDGQNIRSSFEKKRNHTWWINKRSLTSLDLKAKVIRQADGWQVDDRSRVSLDCLLSKWSTDDQPYQPTYMRHKWYNVYYHIKKTTVNMTQWQIKFRKFIYFWRNNSENISTEHNTT